MRKQWWMPEGRGMGHPAVYSDWFLELIEEEHEQHAALATKENRPTD